jgi:catechol 2,3-dioxygenase-like lactoylglutathione lyase family enzyme
METAVFPRMHVSLYVADVAATVKFYTAFFGQPAAKIKPGYAKFVLDAPSLIISFVQNAERVASNFGHLGFQVETVAELAERRAAAEAAGLISREEIGTSCCYAKQDKFWVNDPDGTEWEVYYFHEDAEFNDPRYQAEYDAASSGSAQCCVAPAATLPAEALTTAPIDFPLTIMPVVALATDTTEAGCGCGTPATRTLDSACC